MKSPRQDAPLDRSSVRSARRDSRECFSPRTKKTPRKPLKPLKMASRGTTINTTQRQQRSSRIHWTLTRMSWIKASSGRRWKPSTHRSAQRTEIRAPIMQAETSDGVLELLKRVRGAEQLEDVSTPDLVVATPSSDFADVPTSSKRDSDEPGDKSTVYRSIQRRATPGTQRKRYRRSAKIILHEATPEASAVKDGSMEIGPTCSADGKNSESRLQELGEPAGIILHGATSEASNVNDASAIISPARSNAGKNIFKYRKTPGISMAQRLRDGSTSGTVKSPKKGSKAFPKTPGISMTHRLRVGSASSVATSPRRSPNINPKTPRIVIDPVSPIPPGSHHKERRDFLTSCADDEEYLTAESETEESTQDIIAPEESSQDIIAPEESSQDIIAPGEPQDTIESVEPVASSSRKLNMSAIAHRHREWVEAYEKVSKKKCVTYQKSSPSGPKRSIATYRTKLMQRQIRELQQKRQRCFDLVDDVMQSAAKGASRKEAFFETLRACSEYCASGMNAMPMRGPTERSGKYVSNMLVNLRKKAKSPRRSLGKNIAKAKPSGVKCLSNVLKKNQASKRQSIEGAKSPVVDRSSIRPISELRNIFSPGLRTADVRSRTNLDVKYYAPTRGPGNKFQHVKSPIRQYIRGDN